MAKRTTLGVPGADRLKGVSDGLQVQAGVDLFDSGDRTTKERKGAQMIAVEAIQPAQNQPRQHFDQTEMQELSNSIARRGVQQAITVRVIPAHIQRQDEAKMYELIAGERRLRASKMSPAELVYIPADVIEADDREAALIAGAENLQRANLTPIEEAEYYYRLSTEFGMKGADIANELGVSPSKVTLMLRVARLRGAIDAQLKVIYTAFQHGELPYDRAYKALVQREREIDEGKSRPGRKPADISAPENMDDGEAAFQSVAASVPSTMTPMVATNEDHGHSQQFQQLQPTNSVHRAGVATVKTSAAEDQEAYLDQHRQTRDQATRLTSSQPATTLPFMGNYLDDKQLRDHLTQLLASLNTTQAADVVRDWDLRSVRQIGEQFAALSDRWKDITNGS